MGFDFLLVQPQAFIEKKKPQSKLSGFIKIITNHGKHHKTRLHSISHQKTPINPELGGKSIKKFGFSRQQNSKNRHCPQIVPTVIITVNLYSEKS